MTKISIKQDGITYVIDINDIKYKHFGVKDVYAVVNYFTGNIIYNLDFDDKHGKKYVLTTV